MLVSVVDGTTMEISASLPARLGRSEAIAAWHEYNNRKTLSSDDLKQDLTRLET